MSVVRVEAPWYNYQKKVAAMFSRDPEIEVGEVYQQENGVDYGMDVVVRSREKYLALDRVLNRVMLFGSIALYIKLYDAENTLEDAAIEVYRAIFKGNPVVRGIEDMVDEAGVHHGYVVFEPEIVQFYDDNLSDYRGNWTGLAQGIAREMFDDAAHGVQFCTADIRESMAGALCRKAAGEADPDDAEEPCEPLE